MIVSILVLFTIVVIIAFAFDYYVHHTRAGRLIDQIPGPKGFPIIGNILLLRGTPEELWLRFRTYMDRYYPICKGWGFQLPAISIRHPNDLEVILKSTKNIEKGILYDILKPWLNTGLLISGGAKWHSRRKMLTPTFHFNMLQQFVDIFIGESERMIQKLKSYDGTVEMDVIPFFSEHTLNAICETAMGTSLYNLDEIQKTYRQGIREISKIVLYRLMRPWFYNDTLFALMPAARLQKKILRHLHQFTEKIISERKLYHERTNYKYLQNISNNDTNNDEQVTGIRKKQFAMLDLLIAVSKENHLSDLDIREEVDVFMFGGHDTTTMILSFVLVLLAEHKDIQDRVREEVNTVMEQSGGKLTMTSLQNLTYLERCVKESMRLYPSVHFIARVPVEDVQLRDSYVIPAGTITQLNIYSVHRDPNFWPNPDVFDPDRFLPEKVQKRHPYSYLPFSAGPRNCLGQRFAMLEMKAMLASLVHNFNLEPIDYLKNMEIFPDLVLRPSHPLNVRFVPIELA